MLGRSGPDDVRHTVDLCDAALSPRKSSVAAEVSEGTKGGERPVWSTLWFRKERHATNQFTCLCLVCVFVASGGTDVCLEEGVWAGWFGEEKQARMNPFKTKPHLSSRKSIK